MRRCTLVRVACSGAHRKIGSKNSTRGRKTQDSLTGRRAAKDFGATARPSSSYDESPAPKSTAHTCPALPAAGPSAAEVGRALTSTLLVCLTRRALLHGLCAMLHPGGNCHRSSRPFDVDARTPTRCFCTSPLAARSSCPAPRECHHRVPSSPYMQPCNSMHPPYTRHEDGASWHHTDADVKSKCARKRVSSHHSSPPTRPGRRPPARTTPS